MSTLKNIFFLAVCLLIGLGIGKGFVAWRHAKSHNMEKHEGKPLITGEGDAPGSRGFTVQAADLGNLAEILKQSQSLFATSVAVEYSPGLTKAQLGGAVKAAHQKHMRFILLPPAQFTLQNPYPRPLVEIAAEAQATDVDILCISWLNADPDSDHWAKEAAGVRKVFDGRIILAATPEVMPSVGCWDAVDMLGAIGPIAIPRRLSQADGDLTVRDMRVAWDSSLSSMESLATVHTKPLALLHMNIPGDAKMTPAVRQLAYEALLLETKGRAAVTDVLLFNWGSDGPNGMTGLVPKMTEAWDPKKPRLPDKPAVEEVLDDQAVDVGAEAGK